MQKLIVTVALLPGMEKAGIPCTAKPCSTIYLPAPWWPLLRKHHSANDPITVSLFHYLCLAKTETNTWPNQRAEFRVRQWFRVWLQKRFLASKALVDITRTFPACGPVRDHWPARPPAPPPPPFITEVAGYPASQRQFPTKVLGLRGRRRGGPKACRSLEARRAARPGRPLHTGQQRL